MPAPSESPFPGPGFRDWALVAIGLAFVACGIVILPSNRNVGIVTLVFFGACTAVGVSIVVRKLESKRMRPLRAEIVGGVPIRPLRSRALVAGLGLFVVGAVLVSFGRGYGLIFWALSWGIGAVGVALLVGIALNWLPVGYLQFDPEGITIARRRFRFVVPWDRISRLAAGEFHDNPVLLLWIEPLHAIRTEPQAQHARAVKQLATNQACVGAPLMIMTSQYGIPLPALLKAVERYASDPAARAELGVRKLPAG